MKVYKISKIYSGIKKIMKKKDKHQKKQFEYKNEKQKEEIEGYITVLNQRLHKPVHIDDEIDDYLEDNNYPENKLQMFDIK